MGFLGVPPGVGHRNSSEFLCPLGCTVGRVAFKETILGENIFELLIVSKGMDSFSDEPTMYAIFDIRTKYIEKQGEYKECEPLYTDVFSAYIMPVSSDYEYMAAHGVIKCVY